MRRDHRNAQTRMRRENGFTLMELLVVITIIVLLVSLSVGVGVRLVSNRKADISQNILSTLDRALSSYLVDQQVDAPAFRPAQYVEVPGQSLFPGDAENDAPIETASLEVLSETDAFTAYGGSSRIYPRYPDAAAFLKQAQGIGAVDEILSGIDAWLRPTPGGGNDADIARSVTPSVLDAWGTESWDSNGWAIFEGIPVLYVHPENELAQALYGRCLNGRPYFMSAGPDRLYGVTDQIPTGSDEEKILLAVEALEDNLYSYQPGPAVGVEGDEDEITGNDFNKQYR